MSIVVCNEECEGDLLAKNPVFLSSSTTQNGADIAQKQALRRIFKHLRFITFSFGNVL